MGQAIVKGTYSGKVRRSRQARNPELESILANESHRIRIFELQGALFFASADSLARSVESALECATYCVLDLNQVHEMDSTGASMLLRLMESAERRGKCLVVSGLSDRCCRWDSLQAFGNLRCKLRFADTDAALDYVEERILARARTVRNIRHH